MADKSTYKQGLVKRLARSHGKVSNEELKKLAIAIARKGAQNAPTFVKKNKSLLDRLQRIAARHGYY